MLQELSTNEILELKAKAMLQSRNVAFSRHWKTIKEMSMDGRQVLLMRLTGSQMCQPQKCKALGMDRSPVSIPVFEADRRLDSWHVTASSMPSQQAKLSSPFWAEVSLPHVDLICWPVVQVSLGSRSS